MSSSYLLFAFAERKGLLVFTNNGVDVTSEFSSFAEQRCLGTCFAYTWNQLEGSLNFWPQEGGCGTIDAERGRIAVGTFGGDCIGEECESICQASDGKYWACASNYGQSYGVILTADGSPEGGFGPVPPGSDDERPTGEHDDPLGTEFPISTASLAPAPFMAVSLMSADVHVCNLSGEVVRKIRIGRKTFGLCSVPRPQTASKKDSKQGKPAGKASKNTSETELPLLVIVAEEEAKKVADDVDDASAKVGQKRLRKVLCVEPQRAVFVVDPVDGSVVHTYSGGFGGEMPVFCVALPDGSAAIRMSEGTYLQVPPPCQMGSSSVAGPLLGPDASRSLRGAHCLAGVAVTAARVAKLEAAARSN